MKTITLLKANIFEVLFLSIILIFLASCGKKERHNGSVYNNEAFYSKQQKDKDQIETNFLIAAANTSNSIISKSQVAQKRAESSVKELSKKIEDHQNQLLQKITEMANQKLIIITDMSVTHKRDLYELIDTTNIGFNKTYLNSVSESLEEQIKLFEKISSETNDETILKLVLQYLPEQYQLLRETQRIKTEF